MAEKAKKKILIVDDEPDVVASISEIVESVSGIRYTYDISNCSDGTGACNLIKKSKFDLVFLDRIMPGLRGEQVISEVRKEPGPNQNTPIIMVSGMLSTMQEDLEASQFEKVYFVEKPFQMDKLVRILNLFLHAA